MVSAENNGIPFFLIPFYRKEAELCNNREKVFFREQKKLQRVCSAAFAESGICHLLTQSVTPCLKIAIS